MFDQKPRLYFLSLLVAIGLVLVFLILRPFIYALVLALVFSIVFRPWYYAIWRSLGKNNTLASFVTIFSVLIFILIPLALLGWQIFQEGEQFYFSLSDSFNEGYFSSVLVNLDNQLGRLIPGLENLSSELGAYLKSGLEFILNNLSLIFLNFVRIITSTFVFVIASFYLLRDGSKLKAFVIKNSPLTKEDDQLILEKINDAINSVIKGSLTIALIQGVLSCLGFIIFGVPNPVLWGTVAAIGALIPGLGTAVVLIPAIAYLYFTSSIWATVGLLIWAGLAVGLIDNFLGPILIGKKAKLHPLITLLSVLGGLSLFGPVGFIVGPLTVSLLLVLIDIYATIVAKRD